MYRVIVVPLDGNAFAENALPVAATLARKSGARLHLVHVLDLLRRPEFAKDVPPQDWWGGRAADTAEEYLSGIEARSAWKVGIDTTHAVLTGTIDEEILAEADRAGADLIVMTTHGRKSVQRLWLGSTADRIARSAPMPVLFLRATRERNAIAETEFNRILVPLDGSELSATALPHAKTLAMVNEAEIVLVNVTQPVGIPATALPTGRDATAPLVDALVTTKAAATNYLEDVADEFEYPRISTKVVTSSGPAAEEILLLADQLNVDVIVMTSHGRGGLRRLVLGSVADKLLRGADVPVLLCHPPSRE